MTEKNPSQSLTFERAIEFSLSLADFERSKSFPGHSTFHLERIRLLSERLDNVHNAVPGVHVAGTKGKGSVSALITSILTQAGYKAGLFTSPHLHTVRERVRVGLEPISEEDFAVQIEKIWPDVEAVGRDGGYGGVTFFEMLTALAMAHFRDTGADFQVMEVGLGGRLDSTNVITPEVSVITSISLDHMATLGDTIEKIATEKAGIIKPNVPAVIAWQAEPDAMRVFERVARERNSALISAADRFSVERISAGPEGQSLILSGADSEYRLHTPLLGDYQAENVATAVTAAETLAGMGYEISADAIAAGVREVSWPGRFQIFHRNGRTIVLDGAHNPYSAKRLVETLREYVEYSGVVLVFGALSGHSSHGILAEIAPLNPRIVAVQTRHPRSSWADNVSEVARSLDLNLAAECASVSEGLERAIEIASPEDLVLCTGSLSVAAEVLEDIHGIEPEIYENLTGPRPRADALSEAGELR